MNLAVPKEGQVLSLKLKQQLDECPAKLRAQWETEKSTLSKKWDLKKKRHIHPDHKLGYLKRYVDENFANQSGHNKNQDYFTLLIYIRYFLYHAISWVVVYHFTCISLKIFKTIFVLETRIHTGKLENFQGTLLLRMVGPSYQKVALFPINPLDRRSY